jgi:prepilin-type N-terminal cleavage/methylation domain-containing protein
MVENVRNNRGFSLVEMMIALVIIAFTLLALSAAMINGIAVNLENELSNIDVRLTNQTAEVLLALPIDAANSCGITPDAGEPHYNTSYTYNDSNTCLGTDTNDYKEYPVPILSVKGFKQKYNVTWDVIPISDDLRQITINVSYAHRGLNHSNNAVIYKHRIL